MRKYILLALTAACLCSFKRDSNNENKKVVSAASEKMRSFLDNIPVGSESQFGMANQSEINAATLGIPFRVLTLSPEFYSAKNLAAPYTPYITESNVWRVPVIAGGTMRVLITVDFLNDTYTAGDMGGAGIAQEVQQLMRSRQHGHTYSLLKIYPLSADFLVDIPGGSLADAIFIPLPSARMALSTLGGKQNYTLAETLAAIKERTK